MAISFHPIFLVVILIFFLLFKKSKGTWDTKTSVFEHAILMDNSFVNNSIPTVKTKEQNIKSKIKNIEESEMKILKPKYESIGENLCRQYLEHKYNTKFANQRPSWLKNPITNTNLELDCYSEKLKLALEYNGKQHYLYTPKFHKTKTDFYNQKYRDAIKKRLCSEHGVDFIEVPFTIPHSQIPVYIEEALHMLNRV